MYYNHFYTGCCYVDILSNLEGNSDTRTLCVIVVTVTVEIVLIFGPYLANPSIGVTSLPSVGLRTNSIVSSNSSAVHNQSSASASPLHSTPTLNLNPSGKYVVGNILANSSPNKVVMINFDDGYKSQLIYGKPILDKYGFKASFFIVCGRVGTHTTGRT